VSLVVPLLLDGPLRKGFGLEPLVRDPQAALDRSAVGALGEALLGALDGGELLAQVGREGDRNRLGVELAGGVLVLSVCWRWRDPSSRISLTCSASRASIRVRSRATSSRARNSFTIASG
jgi:hypothetical protein